MAPTLGTCPIRVTMLEGDRRGRGLAQQGVPTVMSESGVQVMLVSFQEDSGGRRRAAVDVCPWTRRGGPGEGATQGRHCAPGFCKALGFWRLASAWGVLQGRCPFSQQLPAEQGCGGHLGSTCCAHRVTRSRDAWPAC